MSDSRPRLQAVPASGPADAEGAPEGPSGVTPPLQRSGRSRFLSDVIVELGMLRPDRIEALTQEARTSGQGLEQLLVASGALTSDQLARAIAERFGLDYVDLTIYRPDPAAISLITPQAARRYGSVPIGFGEEGALLVAIADPSNVLALDDLKLMTGRDLRAVVASTDDIAALIGRMSDLDAAVAEASLDEDEEEEAVVTDIRESADQAPVIRLVNSVIAEAVEDGASDVHFEPEGGDMRVRLRVDGVLSERATIPRRMVPGVISRVKIMGDLDIAERRAPQDGRVGLKVEGRPVDIRIVTLPSVHGEGIALRLLDKEQSLITLDGLGMGEQQLEQFETAFRQSYGAVLATGPTGSGKSTTLYAALNALNAVDRKILTIEDPVEYQVPGITQLQVHRKAGLTFAHALRSMLRADPDVIMVGEIRDAETARIAVESALTGHMVLSTLHTNDASSAISRLTEMGVEPFLSASAIGCVVAQRLVRKLCAYCKRRSILDARALEAAGFRADFDVEGYEPAGCARCGHNGYRGRTGLYEVMLISEEIRALTVERASADDIRRQAVEQGMKLLRDDGLEKVRLGITSIAEVARVT